MRPEEQIDWQSSETRKALRKYFGLWWADPGDWLNRKPFYLGRSNTPKALHSSERHVDGSYVQLNGDGTPAFKERLLDEWDGVPWESFLPAFEYVKRKDYELFNTVWAVMNRYPMDRRHEYPTEKDLNCAERTLYRRCVAFVDIVAECMHINHRQVMPLFAERKKA